MKFKKLTVSGAGLAVLSSMLFATSAFAQPVVRSGMPVSARPAFVGVVSAINGNVITMQGRPNYNGEGQGPEMMPQVLLVDTTNATVMKKGATSTLASIAVNDRIFVHGVLTDRTHVVAKLITDVPVKNDERKEQKKEDRDEHRKATSTLPFIGNGQPVIAGTVSAVNGSQVTVTTASNVAYSVNISQAKIVAGQGQATSSVVAVGHKVVVQGLVNDTTVTASVVIDQSVPFTRGKSAESEGQKKPESRGFMRRMGSFFSRMFGF